MLAGKSSAILAARQEEKRREREAAKAQVAADREARNAAEEEAASASEPDEPQPAAAPCTLCNSFTNMSYCRLASSWVTTKANDHIREYPVAIDSGPSSQHGACVPASLQRSPRAARLALRARGGAPRG